MNVYAIYKLLILHMLQRPTIGSCVASAGGNFYTTNCADTDGCTFVKDTTLRPTTADCLSACTAGYSGSTCYGCVYDSANQYCVLLLGQPYQPPCVP